ncbi:MAG: hypothetical protein WC548_02935 [Candidatus Pacearchaeota archaeon]
MNNKKAQLTIFIILAIIIVSAIIVFFLLIKPDSEIPQEINPKTSVQKCVKGAIELSIQKILDNGGILGSKKSVQYDGENYTFLCYQADYYLSCYNLFPMLNEIIEEEIKSDTKTEVQNCFNLMKEDFEGKGFSVSGGATNYSIEIVPGGINVKLDKKMQISKEESSQNFENFDTNIISSLYELIKISKEIVNSESEYCNFEYNGFMLLYPKFKIWRIEYNNNRIYKVIDRVSGNEFKFSVRSCAYPPGI